MMNLAENIFLACSIVAVLLGIALVSYTLYQLSRKKNLSGSRGQVNLKLFGVEVRGGHTIAIFVVGVSLIYFPQKFSVELMKSPRGNQPQLSIVPKPVNFIEVAEASEPTMDGFHILKDVRVIDLRSRIPIPSDKKDSEYSPITWTRYTLLKKVSAEKEFIDFEFGTTGVNVSPRCLTHEYTLRKITGTHRHGTKELNRTWQVRVDVKEVQVGQVFLVINEVTYWNAFADEFNEWASVPVVEKTDEVTVVVLYPKNKPFKEYALYSQLHNSERLKQFRAPSVILPSANHQVLLWRVNNPIKGNEYRVNWTW